MPLIPDDVVWKCIQIEAMAIAWILLCDVLCVGVINNSVQSGLLIKSAGTIRWKSLAVLQLKSFLIITVLLVNQIQILLKFVR